MLHSEAAQAIRSVFPKAVGRAPTDLEASYCQAVAWLETFYGRGGQFAKLFSEGHVNWGALERSKNADGSCPDGTMLGSDVGTVCFFVYPDDLAAATAFVALLMTGSRSPGKPPIQAIVDAMTGSPTDVAQAMKDGPYKYSAPVDSYAQAIATSLDVISKPGGITDQGVRFSTPAPPPGTPPQVKPGEKPGQAGAWYRKPAVLAGGAALAGAAAFFGYRKMHGRDRRRSRW